MNNFINSCSKSQDFSRPGGGLGRGGGQSSTGDREGREGRELGTPRLPGGTLGGESYIITSWHFC